MSPAAFAVLEIREFHLKHAAFMRAENRRAADVLEIALKTAGDKYKKGDQETMKRQVAALRQYPMKQWLASP